MSILSVPLHDRYALTAYDWSAVHTGYTEMTDDASFDADAGEWSGAHLAYTDTYEPSEVEEEATDNWLPNRQAMWDAVHSPANNDLDNAVDSGSVSGYGSTDNSGSVSMSIQRGGGPETVPGKTMTVKVTVPGTSIIQYYVFPDISPTLSFTLPNVPSGIQTVQIEALSNGSVIATGQFTVDVPDKGGTHEQKDAPTFEPSSKEPKVADDPPAPPPRQQQPRFEAASHRPTERPAEAPQTKAPPEKEKPAPPAPEPPPIEEPEHVAAPKRKKKASRSLQILTAGQIMAAAAAAADVVDLTNVRDPGTSIVAAPGAVADVPKAPSASLQGDGDPTRNPRNPASPEGTNGPKERKVRASRKSGQLPTLDKLSIARLSEPPPGPTPSSGGGFEGAYEVVRGYRQRDYSKVWSGSLKAIASGLSLGGCTAGSPMMIAAGAQLYDGIRAPAPAMRG